MKSWLKKAILPYAVVTIIGLMLVAIFFSIFSSTLSEASACTDSGTVVASPVDVSINPDGIIIAGQPMDSDQKAIAETIIGIGLAPGRIVDGVTDWDIVEELAIAIQETKLTNKTGGDGDSAGVFQETHFWGTYEDAIDVVVATNKQYDHIITIPNREGDDRRLPVALLVQNPDPAAYSSSQNSFLSWVPVAQQIFDSLSDTSETPSTTNTTDTTPTDIAIDDSDTQTSCSGIEETSDQAQTAINAALSVIGTPYVWGGESETDGFDCSGLMWWAYGQAGIQLPRIAVDQYNVGTHVTLVELEPGDLVFWATNPNDPSTIVHVAMYIGENQIVVAPHTGALVEVRDMYLLSGGGSDSAPEYFVGGTRIVDEVPSVAVPTSPITTR